MSNHKVSNDEGATQTDTQQCGPYPYGGNSALQIRVSHARLAGSMKDAENCKSLSAFNDYSDRYGDILPGNPDDRSTGCESRRRTCFFRF